MEAILACHQEWLGRVAISCARELWLTRACACPIQKCFPRHYFISSFQNPLWMIMDEGKKHPGLWARRDLANTAMLLGDWLIRSWPRQEARPRLWIPRWNEKRSGQECRHVVTWWTQHGAMDQTSAPGETSFARPVSWDRSLSAALAYVHAESILHKTSHHTSFLINVLALATHQLQGVIKIR